MCRRGVSIAPQRKRSVPFRRMTLAHHSARTVITRSADALRLGGASESATRTAAFNFQAGLRAISWPTSRMTKFASVRGASSRQANRPQCPPGETLGGNAFMRVCEHCFRRVEAKNRRLVEASGEQLGPVVGATADIGDRTRRSPTNAAEQIARRARPLGDELHLRIPVAGGPARPTDHETGRK